MNPQVEKFLKIPIYQRLLIVLGLMVVVAVVFYFAIFQPKMNEYIRLVQQGTELQAKIAQKKSIADNLVEYQRQYENMQQQLQDSLKELPNDKEIPELLTSIALNAKQNNLDVKKFLPGVEVPKDFYAEVPVALSFSGQYHNIGKFFYDISEIPRIVNIGNIKIKTSPVKGSDKILIAVDCQATTYRFINADEIAQTKKSAAGAKKK